MSVCDVCSTGVFSERTCVAGGFTTLGKAGGRPRIHIPGRRSPNPEEPLPAAVSSHVSLLAENLGHRLILELGEYFRKQSRCNRTRSSAVKNLFLKNANLFQSNWSLLEKQVGPNGSSAFVYAKIVRLEREKKKVRWVQKSARSWKQGLRGRAHRRHSRGWARAEINPGPLFTVSGRSPPVAVWGYTSLSENSQSFFPFPSPKAATPLMPNSTSKPQMWPFFRSNATGIETWKHVLLVQHCIKSHQHFS